jgi:hypothetical protein
MQNGKRNRSGRQRCNVLDVPLGSGKRTSYCTNAETKSAVASSMRMTVYAGDVGGGLGVGGWAGGLGGGVRVSAAHGHRPCDHSQLVERMVNNVCGISWFSGAPGRHPGGPEYVAKHMRPCRGALYFATYAGPPGGLSGAPENRLAPKTLLSNPE